MPQRAFHLHYLGSIFTTPHWRHSVPFHFPSWSLPGDDHTTHTLVASHHTKHPSVVIPETAITCRCVLWWELDLLWANIFSLSISRSPARRLRCEITGRVTTHQHEVHPKSSGIVCGAGGEDWRDIRITKRTWLGMKGQATEMMKAAIIQRIENNGRIKGGMSGFTAACVCRGRMESQIDDIYFFSGDELTLGSVLFWDCPGARKIMIICDVGVILRVPVRVIMSLWTRKLYQYQRSWDNNRFLVLFAVSFPWAGKLVCRVTLGSMNCAKLK